MRKIMRTGVAVMVGSGAILAGSMSMAQAAPATDGNSRAAASWRTTGGGTGIAYYATPAEYTAAATAAKADAKQAAIFDLNQWCGANGYYGKTTVDDGVTYTNRGQGGSAGDYWVSFGATVSGVCND